MATKTESCPFCGRGLGKDGRTCGRAQCQAKAAVWRNGPNRVGRSR